MQIKAPPSSRLFKDDQKGFSIAYSSAEALVGQMDGIAQWWPAMLDTEEMSAPSSGLVLPGNGRKRKKRRQNKTGAKPGEDKKAADGKSHKKRKQTLKKQKKGKCEEPEVEVAPENFRRNAAGESLVVKMMVDVKDLDDVKFPNQPLWTLNARCKLKLGKCHGVAWERCKDEANTYFKAEYCRKTSSQYGKSVREHFQRIIRGLESDKPDRRLWLRLLKDISMATFDG